MDKNLLPTEERVMELNRHIIQEFSVLNDRDQEIV
jgi:hypothetical protein